MLEHDLESLLVDEIADLPERTISDADAMTSGSMRRRRAVGAKTAIHLHGGQAAVDPKPPCIGFAVGRPAQDALVIGEITGLTRAAVALEIIGRTVDDGAQPPSRRVLSEESGNS